LEIKFHHCTALQKGEAYVYYMYNRELEGFFITSIVAANNDKAKMNLASLLKYFFTEISTDKDVYCNLFEDSLDVFSAYLTEAETLNGMPIYKIEAYKDNL
jgi:hypothetical protein